MGEIFSNIHATNDLNLECIRTLTTQQYQDKKPNLRMGKKCQRHFTKENMSIANKHKKRYSISLVTRAVFSAGYHLASIRDIWQWRQFWSSWPACRLLLARSERRPGMQLLSATGQLSTQRIIWPKISIVIREELCIRKMHIRNSTCTSTHVGK